MLFSKSACSGFSSHALTLAFEHGLRPQIRVASVSPFSYVFARVIDGI